MIDAWLKGRLRCPSWSGKHDWQPYGGGVERCTYCGGKRHA